MMRAMWRRVLLAITAAVVSVPFAVPAAAADAADGAVVVLPLTWADIDVGGIAARSYFVNASVIGGAPLPLVVDLRLSAVVLLLQPFCDQLAAGRVCLDVRSSDDNATAGFSDCTGGAAEPGVPRAMPTPTVCALGATSACVETAQNYGIAEMALPDAALDLGQTPFFYVVPPVSEYLLSPDVFRGAAGRLGLAQPDVATPMNVIARVLEDLVAHNGSKPWVVLALNGPRAPATSSIQLGGYLGETEPLWSEVNYLAGCTASKSFAYYVTTFHLGVCGIDALQNNIVYPTSQVLFALDTNEPCLVLPSFIYGVLTTWLPLNCTNAPQIGYGLRCTLNDTLTALDALPPLVFRLEEDGPELRVPLQNLLLPNSSVCLRVYEDLLAQVQRPDLGVYDIYYVPATFGIFGAMALESFDVVFDWGLNRTGLVQKGDNATWSNALCTPSVRETCRGVQTYDAPYNRCLDPDCSLYLFQEYDPASATCQPSIAFKIAMMMIVLLFTGFEVLQGVRYRALIGQLFARPVAES